MDKKYKPLTPPDKKAYEPYVKPKYVSDETTKPYKGRFKPKKSNPKPLYRVCGKCHNIIGLDGYCEFCSYQNEKLVYTTCSL